MPHSPRMDESGVWFEDRLVGYLWRNSVGYIGFRYESSWLNAENSGNHFAISRTLPLTPDDFTAEEGLAHRFFANLLPEGDVRSHIVRDLKIANTDFDLLRAIGGECAGALTILPVEQSPTKDRRYRPLADIELAQLVARRGQIYAAWPANERPRLSLAGAQDKCPVLIAAGQYYLPVSDAATSHILKFELTDYRHLPVYEAFTTYLARRIGLPVVEIELCTIEGQTYAQIKRYDRVWEDTADKQGKVLRLHQEDFCQALGYGHEKKYQDAGGPSFAECFRLLQEISTDPIIDTQYLLRWQIFNVLAGNSDGHAKNLSLLYSQDNGVRLAPFYDLICTRAIERIDTRLAFDVGDQRNPDLIRKTHWNTLAQQCDVRPQFLGNLVQETAALLLENIAGVKESFQQQTGDHPELQRIEQVVKKQCQRAKKEKK